MSGGYSRKGTAHVNRIDRGVDEARRAADEARRVADQPQVERAAKVAAALASRPAVDSSELAVGQWAIDRKMRSGRIVRVNRSTVALKDAETLLWRVGHDDIIAIHEEEQK